MTTIEMMMTATASAQTGTSVPVAARVFIASRQFAGSRLRLSNRSNLRYPGMQPKVCEPMAPRADTFFKSFVFVARIQTR